VCQASRRLSNGYASNLVSSDVFTQSYIVHRVSNAHDAELLAEPSSLRLSDETVHDGQRGTCRNPKRKIA
jgi:hypothetical protein